MDNLLTVSSSPHIRSHESVKKTMWAVNLAILPVAIFSITIFGIDALLIIATCVIFAVGSEYACQKFMKKKVTIDDGSAVITGVLLAMTLPPTLPLYMAATGSIFAIVVAKHSMGGLGYNIFNPALAARAALTLSWPVAMTQWSNLSFTDTVTSSTPLQIIEREGYSSLVDIFGSKLTLYTQMFMGTRNGSIGETSGILLFLGGCFLVYKAYIKWHIPLVMILTVGLTAWVFGGETLFTGDPIVAVLSGGVIFGAFFMATDYVTAPITVKGQMYFAAGIGILTMLIRLLGAYPEGVCYAILLMNSLTPLIDRVTKPRLFGVAKEAK